MKNTWDLVSDAQMIADQMDSILHDDFIGRVKNAYFVSAISVCSIRWRKLGSDNEVFHVINRYLSWDGKGNPDPSTLSMPFFTVTFESEEFTDAYDISIGFVVKDRPHASLQAADCEGCSEEEFCTQQRAEVPAGNFNYIDQAVMNAIDFYSEQWTGYLSELANSIGLDGIKEDLIPVLDNVYDTWDEIPEQLESSYELYRMDPNSGEMIKDPDYCRKDECVSDADSGIHCWQHEDLCAVHDCFSWKDDGRFCFSHED